MTDSPAGEWVVPTCAYPGCTQDRDLYRCSNSDGRLVCVRHRTFRRGRVICRMCDQEAAARRREVQASWQSGQPHRFLLLSSVVAIAMALVLVGLSGFSLGRILLRAGGHSRAGLGAVSYRLTGGSLTGSLAVLFLALIWIWAIVHFWRKSNRVRKGPLGAMGSQARLYWLVTSPGALLLFVIIVCSLGIGGRLMALYGTSSQLDPDGRARELRRSVENRPRGRGY